MTPPASSGPRGQKAHRNRLLRALPRADYQRLGPHLRALSLTFKQSLFEPLKPIPYVYFIESAVISLVTKLDNGEVIEVATIGNEGLAGLPVFLGAVSSPGWAFAQIPGEALRVKAAVFRDEVGQGGGLQGLLKRYTQALFNQIAQSAACNRAHGLEQRCARWLLMTLDRVGAPEFSLTHEFMSQMLGVRRATVTLAAGALQSAGYIEYRRGRVKVVDRARLEARACGCYRVIRDEYERLVP
ncbi:MAG TPA: Crp/Fnr family transcriptional regulator [Polyangiaceae bacterium]|nr:Crp/Fnr family transcriptional regulator [Polyangiaceae bacterium]